MDSIGYVGLLQPIGLVPTSGNGTYDLAWGVLRLEAVKRLGWETVPAMIIDGQLVRLRMAENRRRFELHGFEVDDLQDALDLIDAGDEDPGLVEIQDGSAVRPWSRPEAGEPVVSMG